MELAGIIKVTLSRSPFSRPSFSSSMFQRSPGISQVMVSDLVAETKFERNKQTVVVCRIHHLVPQPFCQMKKVARLSYLSSSNITLDNK